MEKLYRIEELTTEGWTLLDEKAVKLIKSANKYEKKRKKR